MPVAKPKQEKIVLPNPNGPWHSPVLKKHVLRESKTARHLSLSN